MGSTPAVFCMVDMGLLFIAPGVVLRPMFCTWSSLFLWVLAAVAHALAPYSSVGHIVPVYTECEVKRAASVGLVSLFLIDSICSFHERRESCVAPKKIGVCGSILSPSLILTCSFVVEREKTVDWV